MSQTLKEDKMLEEHEEILDENHNLLVENIHIDVLLEHMVARKVVKLRDVTRFSRNNNNTREETAKAFLTHLPSCGSNAFENFCESLGAIRQGWIAQKLRAAVVTKTSSDSGTAQSSTAAAGPKPTPSDEDEGIDLDEADSPITVNVSKCSDAFYEKNKINSYGMDRKPRGIAVIVNVNEIVGMGPRGGTDVDRDNLHQLWTDFGFKVTEYNDEDDLKVEDIIQKMKKLSQSKALNTAQCLIVCLLSHGKNGLIYGTDGLTVRIKDLQENFNNENCPALHNKPKLWFMQACRGDRKDGGVEFEVEGDSAIVPDDPGQQPIFTDFLVAYPTAAGYQAWRNQTKGSFFIQALVKVFQKYAATEDVCAMMHKVNDVVSKKVTSQDGLQFENRSKSQMPEFLSSMRQMHLYFFPGIYKS